MEAPQHPVVVVRLLLFWGFSEGNPPTAWAFLGWIPINFADFSKTGTPKKDGVVGVVFCVSSSSYYYSFFLGFMVLDQTLNQPQCSVVSISGLFEKQPQDDVSTNRELHQDCSVGFPWNQPEKEASAKRPPCAAMARE